MKRVYAPGGAKGASNDMPSWQRQRVSWTQARQAPFLLRASLRRFPPRPARSSRTETVPVAPPASVLPDGALSLRESGKASRPSIRRRPRTPEGRAHALRTTKARSTTTRHRMRLTSPSRLRPASTRRSMSRMACRRPVACHGYRALLRQVRKLAMTSFHANRVPSVGFEERDEFSCLRGRDVPTVERLAGQGVAASIRERGSLARSQSHFAPRILRRVPAIGEVPERRPRVRQAGRAKLRRRWRTGLTVRRLGGASKV